MESFEEKLGQLLSNPDAMQQIMSLAQSLGGTQSPSPPFPSAPPVNTVPPEVPGTNPEQLMRTIMQLTGKAKADPRQMALLQAIKPFLTAERAQTIDRAVRVAQISRMAGAALEQLGLPSQSGR